LVRPSTAARSLSTGPGGGGFRWHVVEADEELAEQSGELILLSL
jgi:hypothetical protein